MLRILLLALRIAWPPDVESSVQVVCSVVQTQRTDAMDCGPETLVKGVATWWRICGYVKQVRESPNGDPVFVWTGTSKDAADKQCFSFIKAYDKRMKSRAQKSE